MPTETKEVKGARAKSLDFVDQFRQQLDELARQRDQSEKKAAEYLDRLQRLQAEMENFQKTTRRQAESVTRQASERLLIKLLPIMDAMQQASKIAESGNSLPPEEIAVGLTMLRKQLIEALRSEGLEEISAVGGAFNPERHEAVSYVETDDAAENTVMEEIRKGYLLNGRVIRPSLVVVSKPKTPKAEAKN